MGTTCRYFWDQKHLSIPAFPVPHLFPDLSLHLFLSPSAALPVWQEIVKNARVIHTYIRLHQWCIDRISKSALKFSKQSWDGWDPNTAALIHEGHVMPTPIAMKRYVVKFKHEFFRINNLQTVDPIVSRTQRLPNYSWCQPLLPKGCIKQRSEDGLQHVSSKGCCIFFLGWDVAEWSYIELSI